MDRDQLIKDSHDNPGVWYAGYDASNAGLPATDCPYGPESERMMNVWLSGYVTATEERSSVGASLGSPAALAQE